MDLGPGSEGRIVYTVLMKEESGETVCIVEPFPFIDGWTSGPAMGVARVARGDTYREDIGALFALGKAFKEFGENMLTEAWKRDADMQITKNVKKAGVFVTDWVDFPPGWTVLDLRANAEQLHHSETGLAPARLPGDEAPIHQNEERDVIFHDVQSDEAPGDSKPLSKISTPAEIREALGHDGHPVDAVAVNTNVAFSGPLASPPRRSFIDWIMGRSRR